jgi:tetratricopeptide (TPR) repeat protein/DNA-binding winged helix-turn-helix (wHTH) protein
MRLLDKQIYRFEGVELDPSQGCLRLRGEEIYIRQKLLQLLVYLIEHRHRVVTKNELIETIWEGAAITDDALVQSIKELRRSLGDDPRQPRFIKTLPKTGYRFIASVEEVCLDEIAAIHIEESTSVEVEYEEITDETRRRGDAETQRFLRVSVSPRLRVFLAVAAVTLIVGALAMYVLPESQQRYQSPVEVTLPQLPGKRSVAVMYFENQSASSDLDWLREGLADMLITNLSRSKRLTVLGRQQFHLLLERIDHRQADAIRLDEAVEIGRKSKAEVIVMGSFARLGEKVRINVHLYSARTGQLLASESSDADKPDDILAQVDLLSLKLATHLGSSPEEQKDRRAIASVMTNNLDAYRYYSLALEKAQAYHTNEAIRLWEKAIELDPEFAMAYARIGYTYRFIRVNETERAKPYFEKSLSLSHRLTEKDKLYVKAWHEADTEASVHLLREIISEYPQEIEAYLRLGYILAHTERPEEAVAVYKQGLLFDPEAGEIHNALGFSCAALGRYDEAIAAHRSYVELAPDEPNARDSLGMTYIEAGHYEEAVAEFERALALNPDFHFARLHLGDVCFRLGRYREAISQYQRFLQLAPSNWDAGVGYHRLVVLYLKKGDIKKAEDAARREASHKNDLGGAFLVALARGDLQTAEKMKERIFADHRLFEKNTLDYFRGLYALKSGRDGDAIAYFREAVRRPPHLLNVVGIEDCLANAYLATGRLDEAISEYERLLHINPNYPPAHYNLAQACQRKGESEKARSHYQRFIRIWSAADPDIPELITAREYLTARP